MNIQLVLVGIIALVALFYIIRHFVKISKSHNCAECSLMKMKDEGAQHKIKKSKA